jgi:tetratricopeptide (TPR) repeat protein
MMRPTPRCSKNSGAMRVVSTALVALLLALSGAARADNQDDKSVALALFEQGRTFVAQGDYANAAVKFEGAAKILHTFGILFNLATCYEKLGRTASAWSTWREAGSIARAARKPDDEARAAERERALAPALSQLTIVVPPTAKLPDLEIARNGGAVPRAAWDTALPVDPGEQSIELHASGRKAQRLSIVVAPNGDKKTLTIPVLEADPTASQVTPPAPVAEGPNVATAPPVDTAKPSSSRSVVGWVTAGAGAAVLVAGIVEWRLGQGKMDDALSQANAAIASNDRASYQAASDDHASGQTQRTVGFVLLGVGGAATVTGVALALTAPRAQAESAGLRLAPWFGANGSGLVCTGRW